MSGNLNTILFQLTILFFYTPHCHSQLLCAEFHFPGLADSTITRIETSSLVLPFRLTRTSWCLKDTLKNFDIEVVKQHKRSEHISCRITHVNGECSVTSVRGSPCTCPEDGVYTFAKTTDRRDSGEWIWRTPGENTKEKSLTFNIEYAADIKSLTLTGTPPHEVKANGSKLDIACVWENGNPSVTARLLDRHGEELSARDTTGQIRYTFPAVGCQDAGVIRCEAPGARNNKTTTLLVRCPPEITLDEAMLDSESEVELRFTVRSHTRNLVDCRLWKMPKSSSTLIHICSLGRLAGSPPDLTLTVRLDNVREEEGQWRLELANDAGTGYVDIHLSEEDLSGDVVSRKVVGISTAGAGALCIVTACVVTCVVMRRRLSTCGVSGARKDKPARSLRKCDNPCQRSSGTSNGYYESGDGVDDLEMESAYCRTRPVRDSQDGYLRPMTTRESECYINMS